LSRPAYFLKLYVNFLLTHLFYFRNKWVFTAKWEDLQTHCIPRENNISLNMAHLKSGNIQNKNRCYNLISVIILFYFILFYNFCSPSATGLHRSRLIIQKQLHCFISVYIKKTSVEEEVSTLVHHTFYDRNRSCLIHSAIELHALI
jgi:hypothetical protein